MDQHQVHLVTVPKWGMAMEEGQVTSWHVVEGEVVSAGQDIVDVESTKIASAVQTKVGGVLRRQAAAVGQKLPVGALLGVVADPSVPDVVVDEYVANFAISGAQQEVSPDAVSVRSVELSAGRIQYVAQGEGGTPVLFVHGFGGDKNNWLLNLAPLASGHVVYALDLPGHGGSTKKLASGSSADLTQCVVEFIEAVVGRPVHLVGHSLGGGLCERVALERPELVLSLALVASTGLGPEINGAYIKAFCDAKSRREMKAALGDLFSDGTLVSARMTEDMLRFKRIVGVEDALARIAGSAFDGSVQREVLADKLTGLAAPVLVVWGRDDKILPVHHAAHISARKSLLLEKCGHMPMMEAATAVNASIHEFLEAVDSERE